MKKIVLIGLLFFSGCLQGSNVEIANWPYGYKSAVCPTFEAEIAGAEDMAKIARAIGSKNATFFVVAGYLQEKPQDLELIREYEIASMGWDQSIWKEYTLAEKFQLEEMEKAHTWLGEIGFAPVGFRTPFLKGNKDTFGALKKIGYKYDSSLCCGFFPYFIDDIVEIPPSLNFDIHWSNESMKYSTLPVYFALQESQEKDGLFTFYAHVDTASDNIENLTRLMNYINAQNIWVASGKEIAEWWSSKNNLKLSVIRKKISVSNKGKQSIAGVTVKIKPRKAVKGAIYISKDEEAVYAVLPTIEAGRTVSITIE